MPPTPLYAGATGKTLLAQTSQSPVILAKARISLQQAVPHLAAFPPSANRNAATARFAARDAGLRQHDGCVARAVGVAGVEQETAAGCVVRAE